MAPSPYRVRPHGQRGGGDERVMQLYGNKSASGTPPSTRSLIRILGGKIQVNDQEEGRGGSSFLPLRGGGGMGGMIGNPYNNELTDEADYFHMPSYGHEAPVDSYNELRHRQRGGGVLRSILGLFGNVAKATAKSVVKTAVAGTKLGARAGTRAGVGAAAAAKATKAASARAAKEVIKQFKLKVGKVAAKFKKVTTKPRNLFVNKLSNVRSGSKGYKKWTPRHVPGLAPGPSRATLNSLRHNKKVVRALAKTKAKAIKFSSKKQIRLIQ